MCVVLAKDARAHVLFAPVMQVIVMSPDAEEALMPQGGTPLDPDAVYVIGGIVDRTIKKGMTLQYAVSEGHGNMPARLCFAGSAALMCALLMGSGLQVGPANATAQAEAGACRERTHL
jgi:hypothetical protein